MGENITEKNGYDLRYSGQEDLRFLQSWIQSPDVIQWLPISSESDVEAMAKNWIGFSRFGASLTATYEGQPVGIATLFLMPYRKLIHHCLVYFAVNPEMTRHGVGSSIIRNINHLGKSYFHFERMHVETFEGCPAIPVLEKQGYKQVIRQEKFVKEEAGKYLARIILEVKL